VLVLVLVSCESRTDEMRNKHRTETEQQLTEPGRHSQLPQAPIETIRKAKSVVNIEDSLEIDTLFLAAREMIIRTAPYKMFGMIGIHSVYWKDGIIVQRNWSVDSSKNWIASFGYWYQVPVPIPRDRFFNYVKRQISGELMRSDTIKIVKIGEHGFTVAFGFNPRVIWTNQNVQGTASFLTRRLNVRVDKSIGKDTTVQIAESESRAIAIPDTIWGVAGTTRLAYDEGGIITSQLWEPHPMAAVVTVATELYDLIEQRFERIGRLDYSIFFVNGKDSLTYAYDLDKQLQLLRY
jgi:hypothetical protein